MNATNLIQLARAKKRDRVLGFLNLAFNDFAYPVYLFGSYATGQFHGYSDVDIVIIAPDTLAKKVYRQACIQMAELGMNYDILIVSSINRLNSSIVSSLQAVSATAPSCDDLDNCSRHDSTPLLHGVVPAQSMQSNISDQPRQASPSPYRNQQGLTLVELMIAMLLGLFLLGGLLQIFISSRHTYTMQEGLSRLQENGRFAMDFITRDIRMAGFLGCHEAVANSIPNPVNNPVTPPLATNNIITGNNNVINANWSAAACNNNCIAGTDAITMRHAESCGGYLTAPAPASGVISIPGPPGPPTPNSCGINVNDALIIADCKKANIFRAAPNSTNTVIQHANFPDPAPYNTNAEVFMYRDHSYFIRTGPGGRPALWMLDNTQAVGGNNPVELVEGIEDMQICYGEDNDMDPTTGISTDYVPGFYVPANAVIDWSRVVSVRISIVAATIDDNLTAQPQPAVPFSCDNVNTPTGDRRLRRVFNSTIALRNRLP